MKKLLFLLPLFLIGAITVAQDAIEKSQSDFTEIKSYDKLNVILVSSNENRVVITGKHKNDVQISNENKVLRIRMEFGDKFEGDETTVTVYYTGISIIDANEGSTITSEDTIKQEKIELSSQEGSVITLKVDVDYNQSKAVTGGSIALSGKAVKQDVSLNTGGKFHGDTCISETTHVAVRAGGIGNVNASKLVDAKVRAGGSVNIYGHPETVNESKLFGGSINRME